MQSSSRSNRKFFSNLSTRFQGLLDRIYNYQGEVLTPAEGITDTWAAPGEWFDRWGSRAAYFLHYFQSQGLGPTSNECVTTSAVIAMNMMEDRVACSSGDGSFQFQASLLIEDFIRELDAKGISAWKYRFSTKSILPGMMPPAGARRALRAHAARVKQKYGRSYRVETQSHLTPNDLIQALEQQKIILLHGAWQTRLTDQKDWHLALMGGMPHTMLLVGYEREQDNWNIINPAEPWLTSRTTEYHPHLFRMNTPQLLDFWGRKFLFYPPRLSITTLTED